MKRVTHKGSMQYLKQFCQLAPQIGCFFANKLTVSLQIKSSNRCYRCTLLNFYFSAALPVARVLSTEWLSASFLMEIMENLQIVILEICQKRGGLASWCLVQLWLQKWRKQPPLHHLLVTGWNQCRKRLTGGLVLGQR